MKRGLARRTPVHAPPARVDARTTRSRGRSLLGVLLLGPFLAQADATIANVATPSIHANLGASGAALELVIGGYLIAFALLLITGARLGQTHGYRRMFLAGVAVFSFASLTCGLAPDPGVLVVARVLQGSGAALMFPQTLTGIQLNFTGAERKRAIGLYALALSSGAVIGQILGGVVISANLAGTHWRSIFLINVPVGAAAIAGALKYLPADDRRASRRVDLTGVATLAASMLLLVLPLVLGRVDGWPTWSWLCLAASLPAWALFLLVEKRQHARGVSPLVNVQVLARSAVTWSLLTLFVATGTYYALLFTLAQYLQQGLGHSPFVSGFTLVPWVAAFGLAGQVVRRLPARTAAFAPAVGCLLLTTAYAAISVTLFTGSHPLGLFIALLGAGGFGLGIQFSALIAHLTNAVPSDYASDISGVSTTTGQIGGAIAVAAFGTWYLSVAHAGSFHATHAFAVVTAGLAAVALVASGAARRATRGNKPRHAGSISRVIAFYGPLAQAANRWAEQLDEHDRYPDTLSAFLALCHRAGQKRPTPLLLRYRTGDWNALHQDIYGEIAFPFQIVTVLDRPGGDFHGGEFVLLEQRPRAQSRAHVIHLQRGAFLIFTTRQRPVRGSRGYYRAAIRHGVSTLTDGQRTTLGMIFHDAS
jgi:predicted MFS family arabinose efflux permease